MNVIPVIRDDILFLLLAMQFININGKILEAGKTLIKVDDHSYRYGDGLFETMKLMEGRILLGGLHFERLFNGFSVLKFQIPKLFTRQGLEKEIIDLCKKNNCNKLARIRLSVSRGSGGLYDCDEEWQYLIECWPLDNTINQLNENGLVIDIFPDAKKSCDVFSNLKSASHLPYVVAARFAKENKLNDCLLLNVYNRICDSTIANLFWIKDKEVFTPPLSEGCIAGVMRKHLIEKLQATSYKLQEKSCQINDLENADEVFLTNAIQGIRWVKEFRDKTFTNTITKDIYREISL
jgi:branched-chain amino acid aminotransferase